MTLHQSLNSSFEGEILLSENLEIEEKITLTEPFTMSAEGAQIHFKNQQACLHLLGHGPFRFRGITFDHSGEQGPTFVLAQDAVVVFEDCCFQGALGGHEESLAGAVQGRGRCRLHFERCHFQSNDHHLRLGGDSLVELRQCLMQEARADGIKMSGSAELTGRDVEISYSGWSGITGSDNAMVRLRDSFMQENGCHGIELIDQSSYQGWKNLFTENGHNGISCGGDATLVSTEDQFLGNGFCGLDLGQQSAALVRGALAAHNKSHGLQIRESSRLNLADSGSTENGGSGFALFGTASLHGEDLVAEGNEFSGLQCSDQSRLTLCRAQVASNKSSGVLCFGRTRVTMEKIRVTHSGGHGLQLSGECQAIVRDCELLDNGRGGLIFAGSTRGLLETSTLARNQIDGLAITDQSKVTVLENLLKGNLRDGIMVSSAGGCQILDNHSQKNIRHGFYAAPGSRPLLGDNRFSENEGEQLCVDTTLARSARRGAKTEEESSTELRPGVTLTIEGAGELHLPFQPKKIERSMLCALAKHGRLSEQALGKVAKSRRVGGAMENLIDRLNKAGMPYIRHDGDGPEGNIYAFKIDTNRIRRAPGDRIQENKTQGREIC